MSSLMGILNNPDTKDKILSIISDTKPEAAKPEPEFSPPPPAPSSLSLADDMFSKNSLDAMLKFKTMMERLNRKDDYRIGLLNSIKPFLKNGRDKNIDTAIKFIQIINFASGR